MSADLPQITPQELREMEQLNPKSIAERSEEKEEQEFLNEFGLTGQPRDSKESDAHSKEHAKSTDNQKHNHQSMSSGVTGPQLFAVTSISLPFLLVGLVAPANWKNLRLSAKEVGGLIMPPGMIMPRDTPAEKMQEMAAVHPRLVAREYGMETKGDRSLEPRIENGVKVFNLEVSVIRWHILPKVAVDAFAYNGQIPGPRIRVTQGDHVRIIVHSQLPESTTVHWHGLLSR